MKTGVPFQTICMTSPGGSSDISTSRQVLRSQRVQPLSRPIMPTAYRRPRLARPAQQMALSMQIWVRRMSVSCSLWSLFQSNQLSRVALKSMWSPKLPGRAEVTKKCGLSGMEWLPLSFLLARSLQSVMSPKLKALSEWGNSYCAPGGSFVSFVTTTFYLVNNIFKSSSPLSQPPQCYSRARVKKWEIKQGRIR